MKWKVFFILCPFIFFTIPNTACGEKDIRVRGKETIHVDVTTHLGDQQVFMEGDTLSFLISVDKDAYIWVIYEDAAGQFMQLLPNTHQQEHYYKSGWYITFPGEDAPFLFKVKAPFGLETLWVFASDVEGPEFEGEVLTNGLKKLKESIVAIKRKIEQNAHSAFGESKLLIQTRIKSNHR